MIDEVFPGESSLLRRLVETLQDTSTHNIMGHSKCMSISYFYFWETVCPSDNRGSGIKKQKEIGPRKATNNHCYAVNV